MQTLKLMLKEYYTPKEIAIIRYMYLCFTYETSKFLIMLIFFTILGLHKEYCIAILALLSIRNFFGGLHFEHYWSCFLFTFLFMGTGIWLSLNVFLARDIELVVLIFSIVMGFFIGPVISNKRRALSEKQFMIYRLCGTIILVIYFSLFYFKITFPYNNICFWVVVLQTLQLIVAKYLRKEKKTHER